jgi:hypothetical protein
MHLRRNFRKSKKGISTVFGMIFFLLIVMVVFASFAIVLNKNLSLEQSMIQVRQMDIDKGNEQIKITGQGTTNLYTDITSNSLTINCIFNNTGTLPVEVIRLWIEDLTNNNVGSLTISGADSILQQGQAKYYRGTVNIQIANPANDQFRFWFVTARGNKFTLEETATIVQTIIQPVSPANEFNIGPFILLFSNDSFRYTADNSPPTPNNPAGSMPDISVSQTAYQIDNDNQRITFNIQIKNGATQNIELSQESFFLVEVRELSGQGAPGTTEYERYFHIVSPSSAYNSLMPYSPDYSQVLLAGQISTLRFAASTVAGSNFLNPEGECQPLQGDGDNGDNLNNLCWTFLVLFWRYQNSPYTYGTTIAYYAIHTLP